MSPLNRKFNRNILIVLYKVSYDTLFIFLIFFVLALISEILLPGIITSHFGMSKIITLILGNIFLITLLGNHLKIENLNQKINKKIILGVSFLGILLILNNLKGVSFYLNLFLTTLSIGVVALFYQVIFQKDRSDL